MVLSLIANKNYQNKVLSRTQIDPVYHINNFLLNIQETNALSQNEINQLTQFIDKDAQPKQIEDNNQILIAQIG